MRKLYFMQWAIAVLFVTGCSKDSTDPEIDDPIGGEDPIENPSPSDGRIVSGDPKLNTFLITSEDEKLYTVDIQTGLEQEIYEFENLTDIEIMAEYDNGKVFVTTDDNSVNALDPFGKRFLWDTPMLEYDFSSLGLTEPVCINEVCYASGGTGVVVALDENTGAVKWYYSSDPDGELDSVLNENDTPIVHGDKVYIFSDEGFISDLLPYMHVLDKNTGELLQKLELPFETTGTPVFQGNILYLPAKNLYAIDVETLEVKWAFAADAVGTPSVLNGKIALQANPVDDSISSRLYCLDAETGNLQWQVDTGFDNLWSPLIIENVVFGIYDEASAIAFARRGTPFAVSLEKGEPLWYRDELAVDQSPVYANGRLIFHGHDVLKTGDTDKDVGLLCLDANSGEVIWINNTFRFNSIVPLVVAENGVFGPSYYRGN
ncbi:MAG: PQQ-binding-like beta-propeller repeat protein [Pricia sp.]